MAKANKQEVTKTNYVLTLSEDEARFLQAVMREFRNYAFGSNKRPEVEEIFWALNDVDISARFKTSWDAVRSFANEKVIDV